MIAATRRGSLVTLAALLLADAAFSFQQTAVIPALPAIQVDLHTPSRWTAWLLSGYLVVASISGPLLGKLADRHGKRRMLLLVLAVFMLGSVGAALAPEIWTLIAFRSLQGIGGAVFPLSLAIVRDELRRDRLAGAVGALTGAFGLGTAAGFGVSGVIVESLSWRFLFGVGAAAILLALGLMAASLPRSAARSTARLDGPGAVLLGGALGLALVGITEGVPLGWGSPVVLGCLAGALVALAAWVRRELVVDEPLLDLGVLSERTVLLTNAASFLLGYALFSSYFLLPYLVTSPRRLGYGFGATTVHAGLYLLPAALGQLVGGPLSGAIGRRAAAKWPFAGGMGLVTAGAAGLAVWHATPLEIAPLVLALGLGFGLAIGVGSTLVARAVSETESGIATALNSVLRRVGGGIGGQVAAILLGVLTIRGGSAPAEQAFVVAFAIGAAVALVGTLLALLVESGPPGGGGEPDPG